MADSRVPAAWAAARARAPWLLPALLPGAVTVYLAFNAGGYFAGEPAAAATVLLVVLAGRFMLADEPAAGLSRALLVCAAALALFALWTLISSTWSDAPARALVEFDRVLLYLVALVLFGSLGGVERLRWIVRGVALAAVVVCAAGLTERLLPDLWAVEYASISVRLSYPVTYWNALGLLAAVGMILCFGMTSSEREPRVVRVISCAALPLLAVALLLTLSRGAIAVAIAGVVLFAVVGHPRALVGGLVAGGVATAVAVIYGYGCDLVLSDRPFTPAALEQGEGLALIVAVCVGAAAMLRTLLLRVDDRLTGAHLTQHARRRSLTVGLVGVTLALLATAVAVDLPRQYDRFVNSEAPSAAIAADPRARLTDPNSSGRIDTWRVATAQFERAPVRGGGAGTYEVAWNQHRPNAALVRDGHSLYLEVLGELGVVGFALLACAILAILGAIALRVRGPDRALYATVFAAAVAWAIAAGIDWHWEVPAVTFWVFAIGGAALARGARTGAAWSPPFWLRGVLAASCCVLALLVPIRVAVSQDRLETALGAFVGGRCDAAEAAARESARAVGSRPQPYEVLAYCALVEADRDVAAERMREALRRDPHNWTLHYGLARLQAMAGRDPRAAAREAHRLNPRDELTRDAVKRFAALQGPAQWRRAAQGMEIVLPDL
jgi:O-antigen ligase